MSKESEIEKDVFKELDKALDNFEFKKIKKKAYWAIFFSGCMAVFTTLILITLGLAMLGGSVWVVVLDAAGRCGRGLEAKSRAFQPVFAKLPKLTVLCDRLT